MLEVEEPKHYKLTLGFSVMKGFLRSWSAEPKMVVHFMEESSGRVLRKTQISSFILDCEARHG